MRLPQTPRPYTVTDSDDPRWALVTFDDGRRVRVPRKPFLPSDNVPTEPFAEGWLDRQIKRSIDTLDAPPEGLRQSMGLTDDAIGGAS